MRKTRVMHVVSALVEYHPVTQGRDVRPETRLVTGLGFCDADMFELLVEVESAFDCVVPEGEFGRVATVSDVVRLVCPLVGANYDAG